MCNNFPSLILVFDKAIEKTTHRAFIPEMDGLAKFITKHSVVFIILFIIVGIRLFWIYNTSVYYNLMKHCRRPCKHFCKCKG
jgi:hypothetical protein